jgi:hypothetical protein
MNDPILYMIIAATSLIGLSFLGVIGLKGFTGWLDLKRAELDAHRAVDQSVPASAVNRIEIADLKERLRKLEAIAAGVDL